MNYVFKTEGKFYNLPKHNLMTTIQHSPISIIEVEEKHLVLEDPDGNRAWVSRSEPISGFLIPDHYDPSYFVRAFTADGYTLVCENDARTAG